MMHPRRAIQRYVAGGLGPRREGALRRHLAGCESCRSYYEAQISLLRILQGAKDEPTSEEDERLLARVLDQAASEGLLAGSSPPKRAPTQRSAGASFATRFFDLLALRPISAAAAAAFALALIVSTSLLLAPRTDLLDRVVAAAPVPVASILEARGLILEGRSLDAEEARGIALHDGEGLVTEADGLAELALASGGTIRLFPHSRATLEEGGRLVMLDLGRVWCQVDASESPFVVRTPSGEARVLGTSFVVEHTSEGRTNVRVLEGLVEVVDGFGQGRVEVAGGRQTHVSRGRAPSEPVVYDTRQDESEWGRLWSRVRAVLLRAVEGLRGLFTSDR